MPGDGLPPLREVLSSLEIVPKRSLGQNFLLDLNLTARIARAAGPLEGAHVLEVGPGPGGLTRALLAEGARHVTAIERDGRCLAALETISRAYPGRLTVIEGDALAVERRTLAGEQAGQPDRIVANLPYNIATPLLTGWLELTVWPPWWDRLVLMFQKEVAERITARPGTRSYGRLSVLAQWRSRAEFLFSVDRRAFTPPPKVTSAVVEIVPAQSPDGAPSCKSISAVTAAAFGQRRKMLRSSLRATGLNPAALIEVAGLEPTMRAEEVSVAGFIELARAYESTRPPGP